MMSHHINPIDHIQTIMPDIFDFFKENEEKLREMPAERVWQKLETRLNKKQRRKRRGIRFLQLGTVALIILLLLFVAIMVWYYSRQR